MHHALMGPFWGNVIILIATGAITVGCFVAMVWMLVRPGEADQQHPKYNILSDDD
jgi:hypothetical protein